MAHCVRHSLSRCAELPPQAGAEQPVLSVEPLYEKNSLTELYCAPACGGKVVAPATKGGHTGMVREVYDSPVFLSISLVSP